MGRKLSARREFVAEGAGLGALHQRLLALEIHVLGARLGDVDIGRADQQRTELGFAQARKNSAKRQDVTSNSSASLSRRRISNVTSLIVTSSSARFILANLRPGLPSMPSPTWAKTCRDQSRSAPPTTTSGLSRPRSARSARITCTRTWAPAPAPG